jgi:hypothetical protein
MGAVGNPAGDCDKIANWSEGATRSADSGKWLKRDRRLVKTRHFEVDGRGRGGAAE